MLVCWDLVREWDPCAGGLSRLGTTGVSTLGDLVSSTLGDLVSSTLGDALVGCCWVMGVNGVVGASCGSSLGRVSTRWSCVASSCRAALTGSPVSSWGSLIWVDEEGYG